MEGPSTSEESTVRLDGFDKEPLSVEETMEILEVFDNSVLSFEETMEGLEKLYMKNNGEDFPEDLRESIYHMKLLVNESIQENAKMLETFSNGQSLVKMYTETVPFGILPPGYSATLHDMKVNSRGPDDKIYNNHPEIRKMIARGTTTMALKGPESWHDVIIYANKKFTGGVGDEDDDQPKNDDIWREYCLEPPENAVKIVCMEKINGDAVHFSGRYIGGKFFLIAGSKNVHLLIRRKSHIDLYKGDRYLMAKKFGATVCDTLQKLDPHSQHLLYSFLHHTKVTAVCEVLQPEYQHIVDLSYLKENQLKFITFTHTASANEEVTLTAFQPHHTLKLASALGLTSASFTEITPASMSNQREQIRSYYQKEGEVLYYLNKDGNTFGIAKAKCVWYVCLRALREKAVHTSQKLKNYKDDFNLKRHIQAVHKRYDEIQEWLKLSPQVLQSWKDLGKFFIEWMCKEINAERLDPRLLRPMFPMYWKRFLEEKNQDDKIKL